MEVEVEGVEFDPNKDYRKDWSLWDWMCHWWHVYFWNWFSEIPRRVKYFVQRGMRGYSDCDLWGMHHYLTETILNMLVELRAKKHGYPATEDEKGELTYDDGRWGDILGEMIDGFAVLRKCDLYEEMVEYAPNMADADREKMEKSMREKYPAWRFTTREEEAKVKRSFELLFKYYHSLWD